MSAHKMTYNYWVMRDQEMVRVELAYRGHFKNHLYSKLTLFQFTQNILHIMAEDAVQYFKEDVDKILGP